MRAGSQVRQGLVDEAPRLLGFPAEPRGAEARLLKRLLDFVRCCLGVPCGDLRAQLSPEMATSDLLQEAVARLASVIA
jgi:hypothetical protein